MVRVSTWEFGSAHCSFSSLKSTKRRTFSDTRTLFQLMLTRTRSYTDTASAATYVCWSASLLYFANKAPLIASAYLTILGLFK